MTLVKKKKLDSFTIWTIRLPKLDKVLCYMSSSCYCLFSIKLNVYLVSKHISYLGLNTVKRQGELLSSQSLE